MARLVWTEPALADLDAIAEYIALDHPDAARRLVTTVFEKVERLKRFPRSGAVPAELRGLPCRQLVVPPCRLFYRVAGKTVYILHVLRAERLLEGDTLELRDPAD